MDCQFVNRLPLQPLLCQFNHSGATSNLLHCDKKVKNRPVAHFNIVRVPPLKIFRESSRPIRSQDSELSTNQRPRFWLNFLHQTNLKSSNGQSICQCTATPSTGVSLLSLYCHSRRGSLFGTLSPVELHLSATSPLECHSDQFSATETDFSSNHANGLPICQWTPTPPTLVSLLSLHCHSSRGSFDGTLSL